MALVYSKGTRVWIPDSAAGWVPGTVNSVSLPADGDPASQATISVTVDGVPSDSAAAVRDYKCTLAALQAVSESNSNSLGSSSATSEQNTLPPLRNPPLLETSEDLASLSNLNEPSGTFQHVA